MIQMWSSTEPGNYIDPTPNLTARVDLIHTHPPPTLSDKRMSTPLQLHIQNSYSDEWYATTHRILGILCNIFMQILAEIEGGLILSRICDPHRSCESFRA